MSSNYVPPEVPDTATSEEPERDGLMIDPQQTVHADHEAPPSTNKWLRIFLGLVLIGILAFVIIDSFTNHHVTTILRQFMEWVEDNPFQGALAVVLVYIVATGKRSSKLTVLVAYG